MKVLVLGGTSFFGRDLVELLCKHDVEVGVFTRGNVPPPTHPKLRWIQGDRDNASDLTKAAKEGWDAVIDNIAYNEAQVATACEAFKSSGRYILTSTISVYRYAKSAYPQPLREEDVEFNRTPFDEDLTNVHWQYAKGKLMAEKACMEQHKIRWTIMRPTIIYGPNDVPHGGFWYLARMREGGPLLLADGGMNAFRMVYSLDTAQSYWEILRTSASLGQIYNVAQEEIITLRDFLDESAKTLGVKPHYVSVPHEILGELGGSYAMPRLWIQDIQKAKREIAFRPTPFSTFAAETARWYLKNESKIKDKVLKTRQAELEIAKSWANSLKGFSHP